MEINPEILSQYIGIYAKEGFPLKLEITLKENQLFAQGTGQAAFPLDAIDASNFKFDAAGIKISFSENTLTLKQGGMTVCYDKGKLIFLKSLHNIKTAILKNVAVFFIFFSATKASTE
jgi:hypothetical protein